MSTRSVIARPTEAGFTGRYHHWDGYPKGVGQTLYEWRIAYFNGDTDAMLRYLLDDHPGGWSTINGSTPQLPARVPPESARIICTTCDLPTWMHYRQYYTNSRYNMLGLLPPPAPEGVFTIGHTPVRPPEGAHGPECYCHGREPDLTERVTDQDNAAGRGCEWAYVLGGPTMLILAPRNGDGSVMVGMFGSGNAAAEWQTVTTVDLDGPKPDWNAIADAWYTKRDAAPTVQSAEDVAAQLETMRLYAN